MLASLKFNNVTWLRTTGERLIISKHTPFCPSLWPPEIWVSQKYVPFNQSGWLNVQVLSFSDAFWRGKRWFLAPFTPSPHLSSPSPFSISRVYFVEKSSPTSLFWHSLFSLLLGIIGFKNYSNIWLWYFGKDHPYVFKNYSGLQTIHAQAEEVFLFVDVLLLLFFSNWLSVVQSIYLKKVSKRCSPLLFFVPPFFLSSFLLSSSFFPFSTTPPVLSYLQNLSTWIRI